MSNNRSCLNTIMNVSMRIGLMMAFLGVVVVVIALIGPGVTDSGDVVGNRVNIVELIYIFASDLVGNPLAAGIIVLVIGIGLILVAVGLASGLDQPPVE